jgi:hypothetical protein
MTTPNQPPSAATVGPEAKEAAFHCVAIVSEWNRSCELPPGQIEPVTAYRQNALEPIIQRAIISATANLRRELEEAVWNLAGCDTIASGWGKPFDYDKSMARPALDTVSRLAADRDALRLEVAALRGALLRTTGSLGLIVKGASPNGVGHIENYEAGKVALAATTRPDHAVVAALRAQIIELRDCVKMGIAVATVYAKSVGKETSSVAEVLERKLAKTSSDYADLVAVGRRELEELRKDKQRLDWLDDTLLEAREAMSFGPGKIIVQHAPAGYGRDDVTKLRDRIDSAATAKGRAL